MPAEEAACGFFPNMDKDTNLGASPSRAAGPSSLGVASDDRGGRPSDAMAATWRVHVEYRPMSMGRIQPAIAADHWNELARTTQPVTALAELIWNAWDADALTVHVDIERNGIDAITRISITDDGDGMTAEQADEAFKWVGNSEKRLRRRTKRYSRLVHGRNGRGRFRAFALGNSAQWNSTTAGERVVVTGVNGTGFFDIESNHLDAPGKSGTTVTLTDPTETATGGLGPAAMAELARHFAELLAVDNGFSVLIDGVPLDPSVLIAHQELVMLKVGSTGELPQLRLVEWKPDTQGVKNKLMFCVDGSTLHETDDLPAVGKLRVSAYVTWPPLLNLAKDLDLANWDHPQLQPLMDATKAAVSDFHRRRAKQRNRDRLQQFKQDGLYPYQGKPNGAAEATERAVFDATVSAAADAIPKDKTQARMSLRLIKEALQASPSALHQVLREVLSLTTEQLDDFALLLGHTTLPNIIHGSKVITDRLHALTDLQRVVHTGKGIANEVDDLHPAIAEHIWVFGDDYVLSAYDAGLTQVLHRHASVLDGQKRSRGTVRDLHGKTRRVDLLLSRSRHDGNSISQLVVELKRPGLEVTRDEVTQIEDYALTVADDPRFNTSSVRWLFVLVAETFDAVVRKRLEQPQFGPNIVYDAGGVTVKVLKWADLFEQNRQRLHFFKDLLAVVPTESESIDAALDRLGGERSSAVPLAQ